MVTIKQQKYINSYNKATNIYIQCYIKSNLEFVAAGISLTYTRKIRGPKIDPCGTPQVTGRGGEVASPIFTTCSRQVR